MINLRDNVLGYCVKNVSKPLTEDLSDIQKYTVEEQVIIKYIILTSKTEGRDIGEVSDEVLDMVRKINHISTTNKYTNNRLSELYHTIFEYYQNLGDCSEDKFIKYAGDLLSNCVSPTTT